MPRIIHSNSARPAPRSRLISTDPERHAAYQAQADENYEAQLAYASARFAQLAADRRQANIRAAARRMGVDHP